MEKIKAALYAVAITGYVIISFISLPFLWLTWRLGLSTALSDVFEGPDHDDQD